MLPQATYEQRTAGILVRQGDDQYLAQGWDLADPEVGQIIGQAQNYGLRCLIRQGHPQPWNRQHGVKYLAFSQTPDDRWVFALDEYSRTGKDRVISRVTFQKRFIAELEYGGVQCSYPKGGGKNIFVPLAELETALAAIFPLGTAK